MVQVTTFLTRAAQVATILINLACLYAALDDFPRAYSHFINAQQIDGKPPFFGALPHVFNLPIHDSFDNHLALVTNVSGVKDMQTLILNNDSGLYIVYLKISSS